MADKAVKLLNEYFDKAYSVDTTDKFNELCKEYSQLIPQADPDDEIERLMKNAFEAMSLVLSLENELKTKKERLSETEKAENDKVQRLIDLNLFTYHFQPIVRADTGEIYSYEALMRAGDIKDITPFHILKYSELTDRLDEIEKYTFLNVLHFIEQHPGLFTDKLVFINSMPSVHIDSESQAEIERLLDSLSDKVVVEMTESSEYNDEELNDIKRKFFHLNIPIAIDDYGTGYSNISNLLRYTPNYVKIDRSLLSGIQDNPNKKHFVREIIDFCHDNGIKALAEGVESSEELRTVILLGADLIQGFYTARPSAEVIQSLPYEIKAEIKAHYQEREDGRRLRIYSAENGERVSLERLSKDGYNCIRIGSGYSWGNVTVSGSAYLEPKLHIEVAESFCGELTLENARLTNLTERPCIDICSGSSVTLNLVGSSKLVNSGIRVDEKASLTLKGEGDLDIMLGSSDYYGIGNDKASRHGELIFDQDGTVSITAESHAGTLIGSGQGGEIRILRGRYVLRGAGSLNVCVGSIDGDTKIELHGYDLDGTALGAVGVIIGSMNGSADIHAIYSSIKCTSASQFSASIGNVDGDSVRLHIESANIETKISADALTVFGALRGDSDIKLERSTVKADAEGAKALIFGSWQKGAGLGLTDSDISAKLSTELDTYINHGLSDICTSGGRFRFNVNDKEYTDPIS